jgi:hypothetical protein
MVDSTPSHKGPISALHVAFPPSWLHRALPAIPRRPAALAPTGFTRPCAETVPPWSGGPDLLKLISLGPPRASVAPERVALTHGSPLARWRPIFRECLGEFAPRRRKLLTDQCSLSFLVGILLDYTISIIDEFLTLSSSSL